MAVLYADTFFYVAVLDPDDTFHARARQLAQIIESDGKCTSDPVLVEVLAWAGSRGSYQRASALAFVDALRADPTVTIVRQTPELFDAGLELYRRRPDKGYSLTDTMSMVICREHDIEQVLTHDRHFAQEGFEILL